MDFDLVFELAYLCKLKDAYGIVTHSVSTNITAGLSVYDNVVR